MCIKDNAEEVYRSFRDYAYEVSQVQHYESVDRLGSKDHPGLPGAAFYKTLCGYKCLIDCYQILYNKDCIELKEFSAHLGKMLKHQLLLAHVVPKYHSECRMQLIKEIMDQLESTGVTYVACNKFYGVAHGAMLKCVKNNDGNYCEIVYNAGFGSDYDNDDIVNLDALLKMNGITNYNKKKCMLFWSQIYY